MNTKPLTQTRDMREVIRMNDLFKREQTMRSKLEKVRLELTRVVNDIQASERVTYTGWCVLLVKEGEGWKCVGVVNPSREVELSVEDFDMVLPIPDPNTLPEFEGF